MYPFIGKKLLSFSCILLGISFLTFLLLHISPADPAYLKLAAAGVPPTREALEMERHIMGIDKPFLEQYFIWLKNVIHGNFGTSYQYDTPVLPIFLRDLPNTIKLVFLGLIVSGMISFFSAMISAFCKNTWIDSFLKNISNISIAIPDFYLTLLFMYIFSVRLHILPIVSRSDTKSLILPVLVLGIVSSGKPTRYIRSRLLEELSKDYVKGAYARGLSAPLVMFHHVLKNSMVGIITVIGLTLGNLLGGTAAIEFLTSYKGVGNLILEAIEHRDMPMIQLYVLWMAMSFLLINLLVDFSYHFFNPQIKWKIKQNGRRHHHES
ncbi:MAG: ABC transporter permease [Fusobacterium necrophorum]|nr:ABC transporter permease [Fusobacterium necrophorum]MCI7681643.1 ABC transporter permease [Fusobacterium necrophorum]